MTTTATATYAYDQIDQARTELNAVAKQVIFDTAWQSRLDSWIAQVAMSHNFDSEIGTR